MFKCLTATRADRRPNFPNGWQTGISTLLVGAVAAMLLPAISSTEARAEPGRQPNIVLIMADDLGQETLGCYGGESYDTPHIDKLAETGTRFRHCYSMPVCHPTRVCLLTGRYPFRLDNPGWGSFPESAEKQTLAHVLKRAGYATAIAGKWQLVLQKRNPDHPQELGFDESAVFGWHEGPRFWKPLIYENGKLHQYERDVYGPDVYTQFLIDFMEENRERPFFAYYSMALCHAVADDFEDPVPFAPGKDRYESYGEMVEATDERVGRLVKALDRLGLRQETLILFTGDNGTPKRNIDTAKDGKLIRRPFTVKVNGKEVRGGKGELTDAGTRVPLIANWRGTTPAGRVVDGLVDFSDFLPTLAELGEAQLPQGVTIDGHSFAARLRGKEGDSREWAYAERRGNRYWVRTQWWKLYHDGRLFNVAEDPRETNPIPKDEQSKQAAAARKKLRRAMKQLRSAE